MGHNTTATPIVGTQPLFYSVGMRLRARKIAATLAAVPAVLALIPAFSFLAARWHSRRDASRLLACARELHPGITTEAESRKALSAFSWYHVKGQEWIFDHPVAARDSYEIFNYPDWVHGVALHLPDWVNEHIWFLPITGFSVSPRYQNGELVLLEITETQLGRDDTYYAATVRVLSTSTEKDEPELPFSFSGFDVNPTHPVLLDEKGKRIGPPLIGRERVTLDERASHEQFVQAFNFRLSCLTSLLGCHGAREILAIGD